MLNLLKPIETKINNIENMYGNRLSVLESNVKCLESDNYIKDQKIEILTEIVVNMQKSLNNADGIKRSNNVVIKGLTEGPIVDKDDDDNEITINNDNEKVKRLLKKKMRCQKFTDEMIDRFEYVRIGKSQDNRPRVLKVKLASTQERNDFLENSGTLKNSIEPWKSIYIHKDLHPVYVSENARLERRNVNCLTIPKIVIKILKLKMES